MTGIFDDPTAAERNAYLNPPPSPKEREQPKSLERWRDCDGRVYIIQCIAQHVDDLRLMVIYASLADDSMLVRDLDEFMADVQPDEKPRFERL